MRLNQLSGKAAEDRPWINYLTAIPKIISVPRGENRSSRREKDRAVRLELKQVNRALELSKPGTKEYAELDQRKSELELYEASPHRSVNKPFAGSTE